LQIIIVREEEVQAHLAGQPVASLTEAQQVEILKSKSMSKKNRQPKKSQWSKKLRLE
jgi:hypothetical protein